MTPSTEAPRLRLGVLAIVAVALFAALFARLWYLQVLSSDTFVAQADANRIRVIQVEAPRGRILDRTGKVLVDNRVTMVVTVDRVLYHEIEETERFRMLRRLAAELTRYGTPVSVADLLARVDDVRYSRYAPVPVAEDVKSEELKIYIDEHAEDFPSVRVERVAVRRYTYGNRAAHLIGYVGEINDRELDERKDKPKRYIRGDQVGKGGVERIYEDDLRGTPGTRTFEVDADGNPVKVVAETDPIPGNDVWLTVDIDLQTKAEEELERGLLAARERRPSGDNPPNEGRAGAIVVMDPRNGEIIASASYPTYDPGEFTNGISSARWEYLNNPANDFPIQDRAIQGQYAPGSTFKLVTGYAAVQSGLRDPYSPFRDTGSYTIPECSGERCTFRNAGGTAYGTVDLPEAMTVSSDAYFYSIGADFWAARGRLGDEALQEYARMFGFDFETGVPLPGEADGRIPTPGRRKQQYDANPGLFAERNWFTGDNVNMSIGQGDVAVTPLQLANAYATFANTVDGVATRYAPNVVTKITAASDESVVVRAIEPRINGTVSMPDGVYVPILDGLIGVSKFPAGTARYAFSGFPLASYPIAAKTGTAEVNKKADTAVFVAYGPVPAPEYVVAVVMEESGFGGTAAAPVVRTLFDVFAGVAPPPVVEPGGELQSPLPLAEPVPDVGSN